MQLSKSSIFINKSIKLFSITKNNKTIKKQFYLNQREIFQLFVFFRLCFWFYLKKAPSIYSDDGFYKITFKEKF